jgi:hypothetical protein
MGEGAIDDLVSGRPTIERLVAGDEIRHLESCHRSRGCLVEVVTPDKEQADV